jgi:iron complex outermembrane receptor protein
MHPKSAIAALPLVALVAAFLPLSAASAQEQAPTAQEAVSANETDESQSPSSVGTGASDGGEILVTARRREETSQDVPLAISVVGGEHLDSTGSFNVGRLQQLTPTLQFYSSNPRNTAVNIRGIGVPFGLTNDGIEQGVGIYVDDVYYSRVASATFDFLDVAQIEVLRGPQGTLYGKNTTAGAINITTRQPTFHFEGRAEISIGNLGFKQAKAAVSGPLSDNVAARVALSTTSRDGTVYNVTTDRLINEQDNLGIRGQLLWEPNDALDVTLAGDYSNQDPECCGTVFVGAYPTQRALNRQFAALAAAQNYSPVTTNPFARVTDLDAELNSGNELGGVALRANWNVGIGTLTSVTAWRFWDWKPANDRDFTGLAINTKVNNPSQQEQWTQEFRFSGDAGPFDYVFGAFGYHQKVATQGITEYGPAASRYLLNPGNVAPGATGCAPGATNQLACDPSVLNGLVANNDIRLDNTSAALFGQVAWHVTDALTIQPGVRLNYDKKEGVYNSVVTNGAGQLVTFASTDPRIVAQRGVAPPQLFEVDYEDWNFSYDLNVSYQFTPDVLAYATYAKSFKSGGVNLNGVPTDATGNPILAAGTVEPESVNHYEAGIKSQFWDRKATVNLAVFRTDIEDYQAQVTNGQLGVIRGYLANADNVRSQGVELDLSLRPSERFNLYVNGAYTDAKYTSFPDAPCPPELSGGGTGTPIAAPGVPGNSPANCDISGQRLPGVSEWSFSLGGEANQPVNFFGRDGQVYVGIDANLRSDFSSNPSPSAYTWIDGYELVNLRIGYRSDEGINLFGWMRNAFDTDYFEQLQVPSGNTGLIVGNLGDPRTYGFTIQAEF